MLNNAYIFAEYSTEVMASIDIGIGSIAYEEPRGYWTLVIAPSMNVAWSMMDASCTLEEWLNPEPVRSSGHIEECHRIARQVYSDLYGNSRVIDCEGGMNAHWLCHLVQHDESIDPIYRYRMNFDWEPVYPVWWDARSPVYRWDKPVMSHNDLYGIQKRYGDVDEQSDPFEGVPF